MFISFSITFSRRIEPLTGMLLPHIDVNHFSKASFSFWYVPAFTLFVLVMNFENLQRFFFCFSSKQLEYYQEYRIGLQHLYQAYPFQVFLMFRTLLSKSTTSKKIQFEYYGIQIETFELTTVEYRRMKKLNSETKIRIT